MVKELKKTEISIGWDVGGWSGKNHGLCILKNSGSEMTVIRAGSINVYEVKEIIQNTIENNQGQSVITIAIDAPLQFPELFQQLISQEQALFLDQVQLMQHKNPLAWRATDLLIKNKFGKTPLSASFSFLTSNATVAIAVIGEIKALFPHVAVMPFDEISDIRIMEVYPGLLKSKVLQETSAYSKYKLLTNSTLFKNISGFGYYFDQEKEKTDTADAVICALYGLGLSGTNANVPTLQSAIPSNMLKIAQSEGWIYYPA